MKDLFNKGENTIFTCDIRMESIEKTYKVSLNMVIRKGGLKYTQYKKEVDIVKSFI